MTVHKNDVYYADLSPVIGSEQGGTRPVLVIQKRYQIASVRRNEYRDNRRLPLCSL